MPIPGSRGGSPGADGGVVHRTTPRPRITWSPLSSEMSSASSDPGGLGSRVRTKMPPRDTLVAYCSMNSSMEP